MRTKVEWVKSVCQRGRNSDTVPSPQGSEASLKTKPSKKGNVEEKLHFPPHTYTCQYSLDTVGFFQHPTLLLLLPRAGES